MNKLIEEMGFYEVFNSKSFFLPLIQLRLAKKNIFYIVIFSQFSPDRDLSELIAFAASIYEPMSEKSHSHESENGRIQQKLQKAEENLSLQSVGLSVQTLPDCRGRFSYQRAFEGFLGLLNVAQLQITMKGEHENSIPLKIF